MAGSLRHAGRPYGLILPVWRSRLEELQRRVGSHEPLYLLHYALGDAFAANPPAPYAIAHEDLSHVVVVAYTRVPPAELLAGRARASPDRASRVDWSRVTVVTLPEFRLGDRLGFGCHAAIIRRCKMAGRRCVERMIEPARLPDWLAGQMRGCRLSDLTVQPQLLRTTRRADWEDGGSDGRPMPFDVPTIVVRGVLEVTDPALLEGTLARGVGRHRSFGLGMVWLEG